MKALLLSLLVLPLLVVNALAGSITLGTAASFGVLGASTFTNTGPSVSTEIWSFTPVLRSPVFLRESSTERST
jgi:hypothetical protein